ncbi:MAG: hypothetical protein GEV10_08655 [Streptosporangiales bacterium]|nr:hypothetical protein [Streptosporangiales bacterium]
MASVTMDYALVYSWADTAHDCSPDFDQARGAVGLAGDDAAGGLGGYQSAAAMASFVATWSDTMLDFAAGTLTIGDKLKSSANLVSASDTRSAQEIAASGGDSVQVDILPDGLTWVSGGA